MLSLKYVNIISIFFTIAFVIVDFVFHEQFLFLHTITVPLIFISLIILPTINFLSIKQNRLKILDWLNNLSSFISEYNKIISFALVCLLVLLFARYYILKQHASLPIYFVSILLILNIIIGYTTKNLQAVKSALMSVDYIRLALGFYAICLLLYTLYFNYNEQRIDEIQYLSKNNIFLGLVPIIILYAKLLTCTNNKIFSVVNKILLIVLAIFFADYIFKINFIANARYLKDDILYIETAIILFAIINIIVIKGIKSIIFTKESLLVYLFSILTGLYPLLFLSIKNIGFYSFPLQLVIAFLIFTLFSFSIVNIVYSIENTFAKLFNFKPFLYTITGIFATVLLLNASIMPLLQIDFIKHILLEDNFKLTIFAIMVSIVVSTVMLYRVEYLTTILALLCIFSAYSTYNSYINNHSMQNEEWAKIENKLANVKFVNQPNVYYIELDGYINRDLYNYYGFKRSELDDFLDENNFTYYYGVHSNYGNTLLSNPSTLNMKLHLLSLDSEAILRGDNNVNKLFQNNGYKTFFVSEIPFYLTNGQCAYDSCFFNTKNDINSYYVNTLLNDNIKDLLSPSTINNVNDIIEEVERIIKAVSQKKFVFFEIDRPSHSVWWVPNANISNEFNNYLVYRDSSNNLASKLLKYIISHDKNAIIIVSADHGGQQLGSEKAWNVQKFLDPDMNITGESMFSSLLAIRWGDNASYNFKDKDSNLKSLVNTFRYVFAYMGNNSKILDSLEPDITLTYKDWVLNDTIEQLKNDKVIARVFDKNGNYNIKPIYLLNDTWQIIPYDDVRKQMLDN